MSEENRKPFASLGIAPNLLTILERANFTTPTPIQEKSIPLAIEGKDLLGIAQTGTGKTLAFGIPMIQRVLQGADRGLIILPTRELALQVDESLRKVGTPLGLKTAVLIGGESMQKQLQALRRGPQIVIATPGRLIDHLTQKTIQLDRVRILVLDEADRMLDMGFEPQLRRIMTTVPKERQTLLFSATMPAEIVSMAKSYMKLPLRVEIAPQGTAAERVSQELFFISRDMKPKLLESLLYDYKGSVLVFVRTKFGAKKVTHSILAAGHTASEIHSNRSLAQRRQALEGFKSGRYRILVATDIAARGIDVSGIEVVINYDLPSTAEDYIHRIGRTGRAGAEGHAISFATPDQKMEIRSIERLLRSSLPLGKLPATIPAPPTPPAPRFDPTAGRAPHAPRGYRRSFGGHGKFGRRR